MKWLGVILKTTQENIRFKLKLNSLSTNIEFMTSFNTTILYYNQRKTQKCVSTDKIHSFLSSIDDYNKNGSKHKIYDPQDSFIIEHMYTLGTAASLIHFSNQKCNFFHVTEINVSNWIKTRYVTHFFFFFFFFDTNWSPAIIKTWKECGISVDCTVAVLVNTHGKLAPYIGMCKVWKFF